MASAEFSPDGVNLQLSKEEWWFLTSAASFVLWGERMADHDFRNILMTDPAKAERLAEELSSAEVKARTDGNHWAPRPDWRLGIDE